MDDTNPRIPTGEKTSSRPDSALLSLAADWMLRLQSAPDDPRLRREVDDWLALDAGHRQAWQKVTGAWSLLGEVSVDRSRWPAGPDHSQSSVPAEARASCNRSGVTVLALVACLLVCLLPLAWQHWSPEYRAAVGADLALTLTDGSEVMLGAGSALDTDFTGGERRVRLLGGEAFFRVAPDPGRPFVVQAGDLKARDIGTAFNVRSNDHGFSVSVSDGEVVVDYNSREHRLLPGDQLVMDREGGHLQRHRLPPERVASWRGGWLFVQDRTLADLVDTLERYAPGYILFADNTLSDRRVTGSYDLHNVDAALKAMVQPYGGRILQLTPLLRIVLGPA